MIAYEAYNQFLKFSCMSHFFVKVLSCQTFVLNGMCLPTVYSSYDVSLLLCQHNLIQAYCIVGHNCKCKMHDLLLLHNLKYPNTTVTLYYN